MGNFLIPQNLLRGVIKTNITQDYFSDINIINQYLDNSKNIGLWNTEKRLIQKYSKQQDCILDIGTGAGRVAIGLYNLGYQNITAIDFCQSMIDTAKQLNSNITFEYGDVLNLKHSDNTFDMAIFSFNGLVLIQGRDNRYKAVREVYRVLKNDGVFIFTTHDRRFQKQYKWLWDNEIKLWSIRQQDQRKQDYGDFVFDTPEGTCYFYFNTIEEIIEMLNKCGFIVLDNFKLGRYKERPEVLETCGECRFWVARKEK